MAYQSSFTGPQIDDVIRLCRQVNASTNKSNLEYLAELGAKIQQIDTNTQQINALYGTGSEDPVIPPPINAALSSKLQLDTVNIMGANGQIVKAIDCANGEALSKALIRINDNGTGPNTYAPIYVAGTSAGSISAGVHSASANTHKFVWYRHESDNQELASITTLGQVYGAVWNDYAEYRESLDKEAGRVVCECGDGKLKRSTKRLQPGAEVISDTFGFAIGQTEICDTPIAVAGRVLVYPNEKIGKYKPGDPVCAGPNGTVSKMSRREVRKYPDRIIGTVSEIPTYETWGRHNTKVDGRIWIRIK